MNCWFMRKLFIIALNGTFEDKNTIRVTGENLKNDLIFTINGGPSVDEPEKNEDENTHSMIELRFDWTIWLCK